MTTAGIIHAFSVVAAGIGAGLAPAPGAQAPLLVALQTAMVQALAERRGVAMAQAAATELVLTLAATMTGRSVAAGLVGLLPGVGVPVRAATAALVTEAVGWAAWAWFCREDGEG